MPWHVGVLWPATGTCVEELTLVGTAASATLLDTAAHVIDEDGLCYCAALGSVRLTAVDVSTPSSPTIPDDITVSALESIGKEPGVDVVFCGTSSGNTLHAIDVSNPSALSSISTLTNAALNNGQESWSTAGSRIVLPSITIR